MSNFLVQQRHLETGTPKLVSVLLKEMEQRRVLDAGHLQHFSSAIADVPLVKCAKECSASFNMLKRSTARLMLLQHG